MADRNRRKPPSPLTVPKQHGRKPVNPQRVKPQHGRRPPATPPHSSRGGDCCPMVAAVKAAARGRFRLARRYALMSARLLLKPKPVGWPFPWPWPKPKPPKVA